MTAFDVGRLTLPQVRALYAQRLVNDFPENELKPLGRIERAMARGEYVCYGAMSGAEILAYAFFVRQPGEGGCALVDYYAVRADLRDTGVGSRFLRALIDGPLSGLACVLLEVDDPACAPDAAERAHRERRLRFYLRNGLAETPVTAVVFGAAFRILALPVGPIPSPEETGRVYAALYRAILPRQIYEREVSIDVPSSEGKPG